MIKTVVGFMFHHRCWWFFEGISNEQPPIVGVPLPKKDIPVLVEYAPPPPPPQKKKKRKNKKEEDTPPLFFAWVGSRLPRSFCAEPPRGRESARAPREWRVASRALRSVVLQGLNFDGAYELSLSAGPRLGFQARRRGGEPRSGRSGWNDSGGVWGVGTVGLGFLSFAERNMFRFPLLASKGIYHYWRYLLYIFSRGLNQMEGFDGRGLVVYLKGRSGRRIGT